MSYLVLARKWRPQTFADLVGQEHVAQTLKNAIAQGRIAHAFLFTGARGVGKTTIARVLAKALNCMSSDGPTGEPCTKCVACEEIARGNDVDVKEIDGASNNSVDDVRRLQESLPYLPARDRFKVVIIDEVHMLSTGAFNALLKTLEEPPPHVKFVFATTEVHKVPVTILSRCQRYDFKLIPTQKIRERIAFILGQEKIQHDDAAVALVAREAAGSMRDALSLLDQVIAGAPGAVSGAEAARLLGVADRSVLYDLARSVLSGDAAAALKTVQRVAEEGYDLGTAAREFLAVLRDLVVAKVVPEPGELLDLADEEAKDVMSIARGAERSDLERLFVGFSRTADEVSRAREPRWVLEMALVRLANRPPLVPLDDLVARLVDLEKRLGAGDTRGPSPSGGTGGGAPRAGGGGSSSGGSSGGGGGGTRAPSPQGAPRHKPVESASPREPSIAQSASSPSTASAPSLGSTATAAAPARVPEWLARAQNTVTEPAPAASQSEPAKGERAPSPAAAASAPVDLLDVSSAGALLDPWERVLEGAAGGPMAVLRNAIPLEISRERVRVAFESKSFYARKADNAETRELIAAAAEKTLGARPAVDIVQGGLPPDAPSLARRDEARREEVRAKREQSARSHPLVQSVLEVLGGEIRAVKLDEGRE